MVDSGVLRSLYGGCQVQFLFWKVVGVGPGFLGCHVVNGGMICAGLSDIRGGLVVGKGMGMLVGPHAAVC